jgi:hypothetical protein
MAVTVTGVDEVMRTLQMVVQNEITTLQETYQEEVRKRTPIKSGQARRGWQKRTVSNGKAIANSVPYIGRLENGYSRQAPSGFVNQAIDATLTRRNTRK